MVAPSSPSSSPAAPSQSIHFYPALQTAYTVGESLANRVGLSVKPGGPFTPVSRTRGTLPQLDVYSDLRQRTLGVEVYTTLTQDTSPWWVRLSTGGYYQFTSHADNDRTSPQFGLDANHALGPLIAGASLRAGAVLNKKDLEQLPVELRLNLTLPSARSLSLFLGIGKDAKDWQEPLDIIGGFRVTFNLYPTP